jgi:hypothetical protein
MKRTLAVTALLLTAVALGTSGVSYASTAITKTDTAALANAETAYAKVLSNYKPGAAWLAQYRAALATVVTEQARVTNDLYPPTKPKPKPVTTTTVPRTTTTTAPQPTVVSQATASGDQADASIDPFDFYTGPEELVVQADPPQGGTLNWDIICDEGSGGTADSGFQSQTVLFPTTQMLTLPTTDASGGCSISADAQLEGSGTVTIQWVVSGELVSD